MAAAWFGLKPAVVFGGAATLLIAALWTRLFPELRDVDRFPGYQTDREGLEAMARTSVAAKGAEASS